MSKKQQGNKVAVVKIEEEKRNMGAACTTATRLPFCLSTLSALRGVYSFVDSLFLAGRWFVIPQEKQEENTVSGII